LLDLRNSGDTSGDTSGGVVGYAAIAFCSPGAQSYTAAERTMLLDLARKTVREVVTGERGSQVDATLLPAKFRESKGCFVTLTEDGRLRGCIGHIVAQAPLYAAVIENARNAAVRDHRFEPVRPDELGRIRIELSVLTEPEPLEFKSPQDLLEKLQPGKDGVVLNLAGRTATYLPQVWEHFPAKEDFMNSLAEKAGCAADAWRDPDAKVSTYRVEAWQESMP
jgi:AmmeMemoRadiSam system protein A